MRVTRLHLFCALCSLLPPVSWAQQLALEEVLVAARKILDKFPTEGIKREEEKCASAK